MEEKWWRRVVLELHPAKGEEDEFWRMIKENGFTGPAILMEPETRKITATFEER